MAVPEQRLPYSRSLADIRAEQAGNLERLRSKLNDVNVRDLVPMLVARQVLRSYEMGAVYSQIQPNDQVDKLIEILKTKNHWMGPLVDALIRNGQTGVAEELLKISSPRSEKFA
uniref:CARD domain-containing protein n=1 Tax=Acrobeloides nanus TaxID=290746 RepID=A0A914C1X3_9BILA